MQKKKILVIVIGVFSFILLSAGIFLLWKLNQKDETFAPTDSSASGNTCDGVGARWVVTPEGKSYTYGTEGKNLYFIYTAGDSDGVAPNSFIVEINGKAVQFKVTGTGSNNKTITIQGDINQYKDGKYVDPGEAVLTIKWKDIKGAGGVAPCTTTARYKITNSCDAPKFPAEWGTNEHGWRIDPHLKTYKNCESIPFSFIASDTDGVKKESIKVTIDGKSFTNFQTNQVDGKGIEVKGDLKNGAGNTCLSAGAHELNIVWTDIHDEGNICPCNVNARFNVEPGNNICDPGSIWDPNGKPTGEYKQCQKISYSALLKDRDGIGGATVTLNGKTRDTFKLGPVDAQSSRISETLSDVGKCIAPGTYNLEIKWTDKLGVGAPATNCTLKTSFTVTRELQPDMTITKTPSEICIDNNTEDVKSELSYTIKIKNNGQGEGKISNITDTLDKKVLPSSITNISNGGKVVGQTIVWNLAGADQIFAPGQEKQYTYKYTVQKDALGQYDNKVVATVEQTNTQPSTTIQAQANIPTSCEGPGVPPPQTPPAQTPTVPATGIFDNSLIIVGIGAIIMIIGLGWDWLSPTSGIFINKYRANKRKTFEKKVAKEE